MTLTPQDVPFVDWLRASAIDNEGGDIFTDDNSQSTQSTTKDLGSPFRLHYVYPPPDMNLASPSNSILSQSSGYPTSASPVIFSHRMDSLDSNATLLATPSPKSLRVFPSPISNPTPGCSLNSPFFADATKAFVSTPFEQVYRIQDWNLLHQDISPVLRGGQVGTEAIDTTEGDDTGTDLRVDDRNSFLGRLCSALSPAFNEDTIDNIYDFQSALDAKAPSNNSLTPLTPLSSLSSPEINTPSSSRKRKLPQQISTQRKRARCKHTSSIAGKRRSENKENINPAQPADVVPLYTRRIFPASLPYDPDFALLYRRFPISRYLLLELSECVNISGNSSALMQLIFSSPYSLFHVVHPGGVYNLPRNAVDLYTPRFVKGRGAEKLGLCPICVEPYHRGGESRNVWLAMKFSAYK